MKCAEKICDLHVVTRRDITNIASIIDNEFKELREAAGEVTEAIDSGREVSLFAFARLRSALAHTTKGTHDKAE